VPNSARILLVDDELAVRQLLAEGLRMAGYECAMAGNASEALQRLAQERFDLLLSDIQMPGGSGTELLRVVRERYADLDVVMITAVVDVDVALVAIRNGASDYLPKPFNLEQVLITIERVLEKRRLVNENKMYQLGLEVKVQERTAELMAKTQEIEALFGELEENYQSTLEALVEALDLRDAETQGHSLRVVEFTAEIALALGIGGGDLIEVRRGALLHDVGKIGIPDAILRKPGKLNEEEWVEMRKHPDLGYQMLSGIKFLDTPREIVLSHQERFDGTGYPRKLAGEKIPLGARVFAVADTFDAMTSTRPYRTGLPYEVARKEIFDWSGRQFDPRIVDAFLKISPEKWLEIRNDVTQRVREAESKAAGFRF
jgi:putative nucleotidyltransferase with HDIG domain